MEKNIYDWLEGINKEFVKKKIPYGERSSIAIREYEKVTERKYSLFDLTIPNYFRKMKNYDDDYIMFTGAYYYDTRFWKIIINTVYGSPEVNIYDNLKMPGKLITYLDRDEDEVKKYEDHFFCCLEYANSYNHISQLDSQCDFYKEMLLSGHQQLNETITLLTSNEAPNPRAMDSARMTTEILIKAILAKNKLISEESSRKQYGHKIISLLKDFSKQLKQYGINDLEKMIKVYPDIGDRYKGTIWKSEELWEAYKNTQIISKEVVSYLSNQSLISN